MNPWLARLIRDIADACCDAWYTFRPHINAFWDTVPYAYRTLPDTPQDRNDPVMALVVPCDTCNAHTNARCISKYGEVTGPHKSRRDKARAAEQIAGEPAVTP